MNELDDYILEPPGNYRGGLLVTTLLKRVRELRRQGTPAERVMWELLRDRRFLGLKFRRQHQYGTYILDFFCAERRVAVELDGPVHDTPEQQEYDRDRDKFLRDHEIAVVRISNQQLFDNTEQSLYRIRDACYPPPSP